MGATEMRNAIDLNSIRFSECCASKQAGLGLEIRGYWVQKSVFELAQKLINATFTTLTWNKPLQVKNICADPDWGSWPWGLRFKLGRCLKYFVEEGMLPLTIVNPGKGGPRRYMRS